MKRSFLFTGLLSLTLSMAGAKATVIPPKAVAPLPLPKQVRWQQMETLAFVHFGLNTFDDKEWGYGDVSPKIFNPAKLDCEQWVRTFVNAGIKEVIITAKHHVFVGASVPFGLVQLGPTQPVRGWDWCSGYHYSDSVIVGFSHTHLSGTGIGDLGDILFFPTQKNERKALFSHEAPFFCWCHRNGILPHNLP